MKPDKEILLVWAILFAGLLLRIYDLAGESIWLDEAISVRLSKLSLSRIVSFPDGNPPLYYIFLHWWVGLFGDSEFLVRLPSVLFGLAAIFMMFKLGEQIFDRDVGVIASLLLGLSVFHLHYSQEARTYALTTLLTVLSMYFFIGLMNERRRVYSAAYILSSILLIYSHIYGVFIIIAQNAYFIPLMIFSKKKCQLELSQWIFYQILLVILFTPWINVVILQMLKVQGGTWRTVPTAWSILNSLTTFSGSRLLFSIFLALALLSLLTVKTAGENSAETNQSFAIRIYRWNVSLLDNTRIFLLVLWVTTPVLLPFVISQFSTPVYDTRYTIVASLAFYILAAKGISNISGNLVKSMVICIIIFMSLMNVFGYYKRIDKDQWREVASYVDANAEKGDLVLFNAGFIRVAYDYYSNRTDIIKRPFPENVHRVDEENIERLWNALEGHRRVWLILSIWEDGTAMMDWKGLIKKTISESYSESYRERYKGIELCLFQKAMDTR